MSSFFDPPDEDYLCCGCGRDMNDAEDGESCPLCCGHGYAPGTEECDFCEYYAECQYRNDN